MDCEHAFQYKRANPTIDTVCVNMLRSVLKARKYHMETTHGEHEHDQHEHISLPAHRFRSYLHIVCYAVR